MQESIFNEGGMDSVLTMATDQMRETMKENDDY